MTITTERPEQAVHYSLGRLVPVLLVGAPLLMVLARLLMVPMDDDGWDQLLTDMAAAQGRSDTGWLLAMAACGLLGITALHLGQQVAVRRPWLGAFATITTAIGWAGCAGVCTAGLVISEAGTLPDRASQVQLQEQLQAGSTSFVYLMCLIGAVGYVALAVGLAKAGVASKGAAVLVGLGGAATLLTQPGPVTAFLVAAALLLAVGNALTSTRR